MLIVGNLPSYSPLKILTFSQKPTDRHDTQCHDSDSTVSSRRTEEIQAGKSCSLFLRLPSRLDDVKVREGICVSGFEAGLAFNHLAFNHLALGSMSWKF